MGMMQLKPMTTSTSHKNSKKKFAARMAWRSLFIFTTNGLYSSRSFLVGDNIEIHLDFMLCNDLFPFLFNDSTSLHYSKYLLGEEKKNVCGDVIAFQVFALKVVSKMFA
jgi:hypothetical protein